MKFLDESGEVKNVNGGKKENGTIVTEVALEMFEL